MEHKENIANTKKEIRCVKKFSQPRVFGWIRIYYRHKKKFRVVYDLSGRRFHSFEEIHQHLLKLESPLGIDCFSFDNFDTWRAHDSLNDGNRILIEDISNGKELLPIRVIGENITEPETFEYVTEFKFTDSIPSLPDSNRETCCDCTDNCADKSKCQCWIYNIKRFNSYSRKKADQKLFGYQYKRLFDVVPTGIFECHEGCKCSDRCFNRVAQQPIGHQLEVFKTTNHGWGVRCLNDIPHGTFVCCYLGEISTKDKVNRMGGSDYANEIIPPANPLLNKRKKRNHGGNAVNYGNVEPIVIDAKTKGNISRFLNHSCDANMWAQNVYVDTHDLRFPRMALFTYRFIAAGEELTIDYYYDYDNDADEDDDDKPAQRTQCKCDTTECRKIML